ncbi:2-heptaprenyl-1,4-naphthoquinone methyltransferase [Aspergillus heteromorphus CBS 117.55]|uniref:2-heptaprenyl-1,4-naphthoquinone methyltransferase n=1 Tax=Aspergillus heteromorphus CBS 117.55 TaxID=1448321 RepID=A0A317WLX9_9EURO|nr:2-heptaprenyl-1,4-naphthoquinone methyltransferase [Aspergillus heteromorphus CBS 117.55]PWY86691.1 2-heptaprenyl-1,4-naphthoquinone methyltransferase [Aspergillus heteromorphus CBS 117.55]
MFSVITHQIQSCSLRLVQKRLRQLSAAVKLVSRVNGEKEDLYDDPTIPDTNKAVIYINHVNFWNRVISDFDLGFAEAYMLQEIDCDHLSRVFDLYIQNRTAIDSGTSIFQFLPRLAQWWRPRNNIDNARTNIASHYDTSNGLFTNFLSADMNYSCAHWSNDPTEPLHVAQRRKIYYMIKKARVQSNHHLLDIGCGWGDLIIEAARKTGCQATGLTLSEEQKSLADERIRDAGLQERVRVLLCDYRNAPKPEEGYDQIISVGMFEHVGPQYLDEYFGVILRLLKREHGVVVIDGITKIHPFHESNPRVGDYIDRYVFPGGYLPTPNILLESLHRGSRGDLEVSSIINTGPHYGRTLLAWRDNFVSNWEHIRSDFCVRYPGAAEKEIEAYRRRWMYYFEYCEAGFRNWILGNYTICAMRTPEVVVDYGTLETCDA